MRVKLGWISWVALGLLIISIMSVFLINPSIPKEPPYIYNHEIYNILYIPLALLSGVAFTIFLIKSRSMPKDHKKPWLFFSVASFSFFTTMLLYLLLVVFKLGDYESFVDILVRQGINLFGLLSIVLIFMGFDSEASKDFWKDRKTIMWPFYLALAVIFFTSIYIRTMWSSFNEILYSVFFMLIPSVLCIKVIKLARNEPISLCYKVLLFGFIVSMLCSIVEVLLKIQALNNIEMLVNLFCVVVAVDIRTSIWLDESKQKVLPVTEEVK